jgi:ribose-phosphate pyrophosphokinase
VRLILATSRYGYQAEALAVELGDRGRLGGIRREDFPDGERGLSVPASAEGADCLLVGGTASDADTLELYDLAAGLVAAGARSLDLVIPYFGYSTSDRATRPGEIVIAKTRAQLFSAIPRAPAGNRVFLFDTHAEGLPYYFEGHLRPFHLDGEPVLLPAIAAAGGENYLLGTVDAGRAKWVGHFADRLGLEVAIVLKRRIDGRRTEVLAVAAPVRGRRVVIYDDMIRTGGSLLGAAEAYLAAGAADVVAVATHGVLPGTAVEDLAASGLLAGITVTDSCPEALPVAPGFLTVISCAPALAIPFRAGG